MLEEHRYVTGHVVLYAPYTVIRDVQIDIYEISHVEAAGMGSDTSTYTFWRATGVIQFLGSYIRVRISADTREQLLLDGKLWEEEAYLEGWSKWVRLTKWRWYAHRPEAIDKLWGKFKKMVWG